MTSGALKLHNSTYLFPQVRGTFSLLTRFTPIPTDAHVSLYSSRYRLVFLHISEVPVSYNQNGSRDLN